MPEVLPVIIGEGDGWTQVQVAGSMTTFTIGFPFFGLDDVSVFHEPAGGNPVRLYRGASYDVTGTPDPAGIYPNGQVVLRLPVSDGTVTMARHTAIQNDATFPLTGYFDRQALNHELGRITAILQDLRRQTESAIRVDETDQWNNPDLILPPLEQAPGQALMFDSLGHPYYGTVVAQGELAVSPFGQQLIMCGDAPAAMALLGFSSYFQSLVGAVDASHLRDLINAGQVTAALDYIPCGMIFAWPGTAVPANSMLCAGQLISRTTYSRLFGIIGITYGAGDGTTTFAIPDLRGRLIAGKDDMGGAAALRITAAKSGFSGSQLGGFGGNESFTIDVAHMPSHTHSTGPGAETYSGNSSVGGLIGYQTNNVTGSVGFTGGGQGFSLLGPTMIQNLLIKVQ